MNSETTAVYKDGERTVADRAPRAEGDGDLGLATGCHAIHLLRRE